ncbi:MAG TPA: iron ABC transporter permease [Pseudomonadales bacterium]|nr:iron ABC transporter permease [Pseudomonadales bacterium]
MKITSQQAVTESRRIVLWPLLIGLAVLLFIVALHMGPAHISIAGAMGDAWHDRLSVDRLIFADVRLPRALLAALIGATLGLSGAALQGLLRNPLAEPGIIGVSNCAALGAVIVFYFGLARFGWFMLPAGGLAGAFLSVVCIFLLAGKQRNVVSLVLAGIAVNAIAGALIALTLNFAPNPYAMQEIVFWLLGSVSNRSMQDVWMLLPFLAVGWAMIFRSGPLLDALILGEETAHSLGFNIARQRWWIVLGIAASVGAAVSVSGNIGFVGLVVPHVLRPLVGYEPRRLLGVSAVGGAILLMLADITVQLLSQGGEMKVGVVTALVGGPFFLYLILRTRSYW